MSGQAVTHGILALSALHLSLTSCVDQQKRYLKSAQIHHVETVTGLRQATNSLNQSNCNAIFAASKATIIFAFAFPLALHPFQLGTALDDLLQAFHVARSSMAVLQETLNWVQAGELGPLAARQDVVPNLGPELQAVIQSLKSLNIALGNEDALHQTAVYNAAIEHLGTSLANMTKDHEATVTVFLWVYRIPAQFMDMMKSKQPFALVILAHFTVVMFHLRQLWWMGDWAVRLTRDIHNDLNAEWRQHLIWTDSIVELNWQSR